MEQVFEDLIDVWCLLEPSIADALCVPADQPMSVVREHIGSMVPYYVRMPDGAHLWLRASQIILIQPSNSVFSPFLKEDAL